MDLSFPDDVHDLMNEYPLAPEMRTVKFEDLSEYAKATLDRHSQYRETGKESKKLVATFHDRKRYVVHHSCFIQLLKLGCVLKKVRQVITFKQRAWLKPFVDKMTALRQAATTELGANTCKRGVNSTYGKEGS